MNSLLIAQNIVKRAFRSKKEIIIMLLLPVIAIGIMTFMTGSPAMQKSTVGIANLDRGIYGVKLVSYLESRNDINMVSMDSESLQAGVKDSKVNLGIVIPSNFSSSIENSKKVQVDFYASSKPGSSERLKQDLNQYIKALYMIESSSADIALKTGKSKTTIIESLSDNIRDAGLSSSYSLGTSQDKSSGQGGIISSLGFAIMFIMVLIFNTIGTIMEDKKRLTIARISTFKVKQWEVAAGNLLGSLFLGMIQLVPVTIVISLIYNIPAGLEMLGLFLILVCFLVATIGLGIGLSGIIKDNYNPALIIATVIFPTCLLGGCLIPESMLPPFMSKLGFVVPQKWVLTAVQQLVSGAGAIDIIFDIGVVLMFGLAFATFGVKMMKPLNE